jgi:hypothetical protein
MDIYLDFDGTVVEHQYPEIGTFNVGSIEIIKKLQSAGHKIILNSRRANCNNGTLEKALIMINQYYCLYLKDTNGNNDFEMMTITEYCKRKLHPMPFYWEQIKQVNELFIDDKAFNIPLKEAVKSFGMMVDWDELDKQFIENGIYEMTFNQ